MATQPRAGTLSLTAERWLNKGEERFFSRNACTSWITLDTGASREVKTGYMGDEEKLRNNVKYGCCQTYYYTSRQYIIEINSYYFWFFFHWHTAKGHLHQKVFERMTQWPEAVFERRRLASSSAPVRPQNIKMHHVFINVHQSSGSKITVTYMFLDVAPYLLTEGSILSHWAWDQVVKGFNIHSHCCKRTKYT